MSKWDVIEGDCIEAMAAMPESSVDAIVTDPPYGLEFMGKDWDRLTADLPRHGQGGSLNEPDPGPWGRRQRVNYGGAQNRLKRCRVCGKREFSGSPCRCPTPDWEIETPQRAPSSMVRMQRWHEAWAREALRVLKPGGHLLAFGGTRTYHRLTCAIEDAGFEIRDCLSWLYGSGFPKSHNIGDGLGTALKPAHEPIVMARKPLSGTVAGNVLAHGTGALNVDGCRIEGDVPSVPQPALNSPTGNVYGYQTGEGRNGEMSSAPGGRWPANVLLDEEAAALLDEQTGQLPSQATRTPGSRGGTGWHGQGFGCADTDYGDTGGASRFFYCAKAGRDERNAGLDGFEQREAGNFEDDSYEWPTDGRGNPRSAPIRKANVHPTVKPIDLMRWLCRLVTPPGGTVLDPFTGSGTTGCAAALQGFDFIGIEREAEYAAIARARIAHWWKQPVQLGLEAA